MAPTRKKFQDGLIARVNFPLYSVKMLTSRHVLVGGGGGSAKTGISNGFEIYEIYHNGQNFVAEEMLRHETGPSVVMNFDIRNGDKRSLLVAGQENNCQLYFVNTRIVDDSEGDLIGKSKKTDHVPGVRQRRTSERNSMSEDIPVTPRDINSNTKRLRFDVKPADLVQTDFSANEPLQRVVRISPNGSIMATGGLDGFVRLWQFPKMLKTVDIKAHTKEIDDLDFSPDNKYLVSLSKDGLGVVWSTASGKKQSQLTWTPPEGTKYLFKRCRFGEIEGQKDKYRLFTLSNPLGKSGKRVRGYLQCWDTESGKLQKAVSVDESLSALAVRDDGRFVAIGSMFSGSVSIYIAFSLQRVLHVPGAHSMFITGLEFLPVTNLDGPTISSDCEAAVVSISVDNRICIHSLQNRFALPAWVAIVLIVGILFLTFLLCSYLKI